MLRSRCEQCGGIPASEIMNSFDTNGCDCCTEAIDTIDRYIYSPETLFLGGGVNPPTCGFFLGTRDVPEDRYIHSERFFPFNYNHSPYVRLIDYPNSTSVQFTQFRLVSTLVNFHFYNLRYTSPLEVFGPNPRIAISVMRGGVEVFNAEAVGPKVTSFSVTYNLELDENDIISMHNPRPNSTLTMRGTGHGFFISFV